MSPLAMFIGASLALTSLHDGPNCFNAVLVGAGFTDSIRYVDNSEYRFYLETFCELRIGEEHAGDLVVFNEPTAVHGALVVGDGKIFEKTSPSGSASHRPVGREIPGLARVKPKSASPYYGGERGNFEIQVYGCERAEAVRLQMAYRNANVNVRLIQNIQARLDDKLRGLTIAPLQDLNRDVVLLTQIVASLDGATESDLYTLVMATSLWGALNAVLVETNTVFVSDLYDESKDLYRELRQLSGRIRLHSNDLKTLRVLREFQKPL